MPTTNSPQNSPYRTVIVDDHELVRIGLQVGLSKSEEISIVGEFGSSEELLEFMAQYSVDLVLLDIDLPGRNGIRTLSDIKRNYPKTKVAMITMHQEKYIFQQALALNADGFFVKNEKPPELIRMILEIMQGKIAYSAYFTNIESLIGSYEHLVEKTPFEVLSKREMEILYFIIGGYSNQEIAETLDIKLSTVEFHKKNIKEKLEIENSSEIIHLAYRHHLIDS